MGIRSRLEIPGGIGQLGSHGKALQFYTGVLGFVKKADGPDDLELYLEPNDHPAAKAYQRANFADGIPATSFAVDDIEKERQRLAQRGVVFQTEPTRVGPVLIAIFEVTCGNLIQLHQHEPVIAPAQP